MNEIFDKLLIRFIFSLFICGVLFLYKYAHHILYPSGRKQVEKKFNPDDNNSDSIHFFGRLIGLCIVFTDLGFNETAGMTLSLLNFLIWSALSILFYLGSLYITESIFFYQFTYTDEILKRKNYAYAITNLVNSLCVAMIIKKVIAESEFSIILLLMFWLLSMVLYGFMGRLYGRISKLNLNVLMIQKNIGFALSFAGFLFGCTNLILTAFSQQHHDIKRYGIQVILAVILSLIIFPIFYNGFFKVFNISTSNKEKDSTTDRVPTIGFGIAEGSLFLASALLTTIIIGHIEFGIIYPFF